MDLYTIYTHVLVEIFIPEHDTTHTTYLIHRQCLEGRNYAERKLSFQSDRHTNISLVYLPIFLLQFRYHVIDAY